MNSQSILILSLLLAFLGCTKEIKYDCISLRESQIIKLDSLNGYELFGQEFEPIGIKYSLRNNDTISVDSFLCDEDKSWKRIKQLALLRVETKEELLLEMPTTGILKADFRGFESHKIKGRIESKSGLILLKISMLKDISHPGISFAGGKGNEYYLDEFKMIYFIDEQSFETLSSIVIQEKRTEIQNGKKIVWNSPVRRDWELRRDELVITEKNSVEKTEKQSRWIKDTKGNYKLLE